MEPSGREGASEKAKTGRFAAPVPLPVLRKGVGEPRARHRAMVEWAPWLLTHKRITQRALLPGAVLTTVGLVARMLLASYVMEFSVSLYARDYGGFGVVLATYLDPAQLGWAASLSPALAERRLLRRGRSTS